MEKKLRVSELLMNGERAYYTKDELEKHFKRLQEEFERKGEEFPPNFKKYIKVEQDGKTRYLPWVDDKHMQSIKNLDGRELSAEELFDFIIAPNCKDLSRSVRDEDKADVAIVLGNGLLSVTRERAIKAFELYRNGMVKKMIFTGFVTKADPIARGDWGKPSESSTLQWDDLPQGDWGAETFVADAFDPDYQKHVQLLSEEFLESIGVHPEDVLSEPLSRSTQENAIFAKNAMDAECLLTGFEARKAIIVSTMSHGARAMRQFEKLYKGCMKLAFCPATLDLEQYGEMKRILHTKPFDENAYYNELKRLYCTVPELKAKLLEETANHRNAFILGDIYEPTLTVHEPELEKGEAR